MIAIATISAKLASTPPSAIAAWFGALASRASASSRITPVAGMVRFVRAACLASIENIPAAARGISAMLPTSSMAIAR